MRHHVAHTSAPLVRALPPLAGGLSLLAPMRFAQASVMSDAVVYVTSSSELTFGVGCAVGAIVGGLVAALVGRRSRRALRRELDEVVAAAQAAAGEGMAAATEADALAMVEADAAVEAGAAIDSGTVVDAPAEAEAPAETEAPAEAEAPKETEAPAETEAPKAKTSVLGVLRDRLGTQAFELIGMERGGDSLHGTKPERESDSDLTLPVISRGAGRRPQAGDFVFAQVRRHYLPRDRAAEIDRRIPRFDESLFPDVTTETKSGEDSFAEAMRAMDDSMEDLSLIDSGDAFYATNGAPSMSDEQSYVDYLVRDEIERNKRGSARRYSRAHLTMFEGTGDLSTMRKAKRHTPKHLHKVSREA